MSQDDLQDLLRAAGAVMAKQLTALPVADRKPIVEALDAGGWTEIRVAVMNRSASVRIVVCNTDGDVAEIMRTDVTPQTS